MIDWQALNIDDAERTRLTDNEIEHCAECLYTLAGANTIAETTSTSDMCGNYAGYDAAELFDAGRRALAYFDKTDNRAKTRAYCRREAAMLVGVAQYRRNSVF